MATTDEFIRQHIHGLLFTYAKTHLTIDHIEWSINIFNLLQPYFLKEVPLHGQNAFTLPLDPFDALFSLHSSDQLPRYEERFRANQEAVQLLKEHLKTRTGTLKTERVLEEDDDDLHFSTEWLCPILTRRSIKAGPIQGRPASLNSVPKSHNILIKSVGIQPVQTEAIEEAEIPYERTLKVLWVMKSEERDAIRDLLKHVTDMRRPRPNYKNSALHAFLHEDNSTDIAPPPEEFTPIFPRSRRIGHRSIVAHEQSLQKLIELIPEANIASEDSDATIANASLQIVDGWHTLKVSSPMSVATPISSQEDDKIDQLFLEDSPPTEPVSGLANEKMEEIEIPRSRRIGGTYGRKAHILHQEILATFLPPLVQKATTKPADEAPPKDSSPVPESLLGHASVDNETIPGSHSDDFDAYIRQLCPNEHPHDIIMKVEVEDEKTGMFMEVPQLPPPNIHSSSPILALPAKISDLTEGKCVSDGRRPLKKVAKGLPALTLSLSWVTFTVDAPLPSHQEISGVSELFTTALTCNDVNRLIQRSLLEDTPFCGARLTILEEDLELPMVVEQDPGPYIAISRRHRQDKVQELDSGDIALECLGADVHQPPSNNEVVGELDQPQIAEDFDTFSYEPSVLLFESADTQAFYDPALSDYVCPSSLDKLHHDQNVAEDTFLNVTNADSFDDATNADTPGANDTLVDCGLMDLTSLGIREPAEPLEPDALYASRLVDFTRLRAKTIKETLPPIPAMALPPSSSPISDVPEDITATIKDPSTLVLPETSNNPKSLHRYMASMDFVQRQAIVRALRILECNVDLAERMSLEGVDVIVDPHSSIIVASLFTLPAYGKQLVDRIWEQSWRFRHILVLLEAYPETLALRPPKSNTDRQNVSAYTPPILKSIRKLRRDVVIGEACGKKRAECSVGYAFANDAMEAATFVRCFGDLSEERDRTGGLLWRTREWLDSETYPDEEDLSQLEGMNRMSAVILLCKATTEEILDMLPEERLEEFGPLIGVDSVKSLNADLKSRFGILDFVEQVKYPDLSFHLYSSS